MTTANPPGLPPKGLEVPTGTKPRRKMRVLWILLWICIPIFGLFFYTLSLVSKSPSTTTLKGGKVVGVVEINDVILDSKIPIEHIRNFVDDSHVKALVIRINSPGGGIAPSQEIFREIIRAREKKKVVASMGTLAASGGYYIAAGADQIMASEGSITGSIGVLMKFINVEELQRWAKVKSDMLTSGQFKAMGSPTKPLAPQEREIFQNIIAEMLEQFIDDIVKGRAGKISKEEVTLLADGRIYTGKEAKRLKLIDHLGNLQDAITLAGKLGGIDGEPKAVYPPEKKIRFRDALMGQQRIHLMDEFVKWIGFHQETIPYFFYSLN